MTDARSAMSLLLDLGPEFWVAGLALALAAALATSTAHELGGRRRPRDKGLLLVCLMTAANVACIVISAGCVLQAERSGRSANGTFNGTVFRGRPPGAAARCERPGPADDDVGPESRDEEAIR